MSRPSFGMLPREQDKVNWLEGGLSPGFYMDLNIACRSLVEQCLKLKVILYDQDFIGTYSIPKEEFESFLLGLDAYPFYSTKDTTYYAWSDGIAMMAFRKNNIIIVHTAMSNLSRSKKIKAWCEKNISKKKQKGEVMAVAQVDQSSLDLVRIGIAGSTFERSNYSPQVVKDFDYIVKQYNSNNPSGRIVILEGEPGTGKTFFVRGLLDELNSSLCVTLPPGTISSLSNPDFVPLLLRYKKPNQPIVLIIEDADQCLVVRNKDNMASISSLLNLGDGIFGSAFDIRIICTTNAKIEEIDPAVTRDGRLCLRSSIACLEYHQANEILERLLPDGDYLKFKDEEAPILASVYKRAQEAGWSPPILVDEEEEEEMEDPDEFKDW